MGHSSTVKRAASRDAASGNLIKSFLFCVFAVFVLIFLLFPKNVLSQDVDASSAEEPLQVFEIGGDSIEDLHAIARRWEAAYDARLHALDQRSVSQDTFSKLVFFIGTLAAIVLGGFAFFGLKRIDDLTKTAELVAKNAVESAFREKSGQGGDLNVLIENIKQQRENMRGLEQELRGYAQLRDIASTAESFDPLVKYYELHYQIQKRKVKALEHRSGSVYVPIEETTYFPEFRQRAALVFKSLLDNVKKDEDSKNPRLSGVDLYNAAAISSEMGLGFVSLEFMEAASRLTDRKSKEIEARLVRQKLAFSRISREKAFSEIEKILSETDGFDLHHVVSEAFNIGIRASNPGGMAIVIQKNLPSQLRSTSIVMLNCARLFFMSDNKKHWADAENFVNQGVLTMSSESRGVRWLESSLNELGSLISEHPHLWPKWRDNIVTSLGTYDSKESLVSRLGKKLTNALQREGLLDNFLRTEIGRMDVDQE